MCNNSHASARAKSVFYFLSEPYVQWERSDSVVECLTRDRGPRVRASPASLRCGP